MQPHSLIPTDSTAQRELLTEALTLPSWRLSQRQLCDVELLLNGGFAPLEGFQSRLDYEGTVKNCRLSGGAVWPIPVVLDVDAKFAEQLAVGGKVALRDEEGALIAVLAISDLWKADRETEVQNVYGTGDSLHPGVDFILNRTNEVYVGGRLTGAMLPKHYDFTDLRMTPLQVRDEFARRGWNRVVAFQTRNPIHRAHFELTKLAAEDVGAHLLLHPAVGMTKPGDVDYFTRVKCYKALLPRYPQDMTLLALLPLAMRMGGPREAVWHAIIRRNFGCTHFIVGRDHAGPGRDARGRPFYEPYAAQELVAKYEREIGIELIKFSEMFYDAKGDKYYPQDKLPKGSDPKSISGTTLRAELGRGEDPPAWFTFPEVLEQLKKTYKPRSRQGVTIFFTGLPCSGKSTIANIVRNKLMELSERSITFLDGDIVRANLSSELGFSRADRDKNIQRIAFVAAEVTKAGGISLCAQIAPYDQARKEARRVVGEQGSFLLVYLDVPADICEKRDVKGLYAKARAGTLAGFTGVSDAYEIPLDADIVLKSAEVTAEACADQIIAVLQREGYIG